MGGSSEAQADQCPGLCPGPQRVATAQAHGTPSSAMCCDDHNQCWTDPAQWTPHPGPIQALRIPSSEDPSTPAGWLPKKCQPSSGRHLEALALPVTNQPRLYMHLALVLCADLRR